MEGKIDMAARRQVTNKLRRVYARASKGDKGLILAEVIATTGMGRSTARRMITGPGLPAPKEQVERRRLKAPCLQRRCTGLARARVGADGHAVPLGPDFILGRVPAWGR